MLFVSHFKSITHQRIKVVGIADRFITDIDPAGKLWYIYIHPPVTGLIIKKNGVLRYVGINGVLKCIGITRLIESLVFFSGKSI